jgi:hypothetical protein
VCTSFLTGGGPCADGASILHKNRDSYPRAQGLCVRAVDGCHRFLGGGDVGDHGVIHFVNERGLAGAMNAGSPSDDTVAEGLPTPSILRLVAEKASDCREALEIVREVVCAGEYTNGHTGSLWLFVDPRRGLVIENTRGSFDHTWVEDDVCARANDFLLPETRRHARPEADRDPRYLRARDAIEAARGRVSAQTTIRLSRDTSTAPRPICGETTLSGFTAVVRADAPPMAWVALGRPGQAAYLPFYADGLGLPLFAMDDSLWSLAAARAAAGEGRNALADLEAFEARLERERRALEARLPLGPGAQAASAPALTAATAAWAAQAFELMEATVGPPLPARG